MVRARRCRAIAVAVLLGGSAYGGDHPARELPPYALQPPGASFERTVTRQQWLMLLREALHQTCVEVVREPLRSLEFGSARLVERVAVRIVGCAPHGPCPPCHQCPEAGGPCTPARLTPLYDSVPAYNALLELIASARCRIDFMIFGWDDNSAGRRVAAALIERARAGVLVRRLRGAACALALAQGVVPVARALGVLSSKNRRAGQPMGGATPRDLGRRGFRIPNWGLARAAPAGYHDARDTVPAVADRAGGGPRDVDRSGEVGAGGRGLRGGRYAPPAGRGVRRVEEALP